MLPSTHFHRERTAETAWFPERFGSQDLAEAYDLCPPLVFIHSRDCHYVSLFPRELLQFSTSSRYMGRQRIKVKCLLPVCSHGCDHVARHTLVGLIGGRSWDEERLKELAHCTRSSASSVESREVEVEADRWGLQVCFPLSLHLI